MSASAKHKATIAAAAKQQGKRRFTKRELLHHLKILGPITNPLPATLPPSPPASRSPSPAPQQRVKRKLDDVDSSSSAASTSSATGPGPGSGPKRSRLSPLAAQAPLTPPGDDPPSGPSHSSGNATRDREATSFPVKRPRKGRKADGGGYSLIHNKYMEYGRLFKRSSDARNNVYARPESVSFCRLLNRPALGSPYAKHDRMMSKFEALDSVFCFAYGQWFREFYSNSHDLLWWQNSASFFEVSKRTFMEAFPNPGPREEALHGIHFLVDAYWRARYAYHIIRYTVDHKVSSLLVEHQKSPNTNKSSPASEASGSGHVNGHGHGRNVSISTNPASLQPTPPNTGLSPAATNGTGSSSSSATAVGSTGSTTLNESSAHSSISRSPPTLPLPEDLARMIQTATKLTIQSSESLVYASSRINLPVLSVHFPRTFARVVKSTLKYNEEYEIDFEDDESELFWPIAPVNGSGLGWVLALGRSMLLEYAREVGYRGVEGVARPEDIVYPNKK